MNSALYRIGYEKCVGICVSRSGRHTVSLSGCASWGANRSVSGSTTVNRGKSWSLSSKGVVLCASISRSRGGGHRGS